MRVGKKKSALSEKLDGVQLNRVVVEMIGMENKRLKLRSEFVMILILVGAATWASSTF